jgi:hypothetical protein
MVIVDEPELPWLAVILVAARVKLPVPELDALTVTVVEPDEAA